MKRSPKHVGTARLERQKTQKPNGHEKVLMTKAFGTVGKMIEMTTIKVEGRRKEGGREIERKFTFINIYTYILLFFL